MRNENQLNLLKLIYLLLRFFNKEFDDWNLLKLNIVNNL